MTRYVAFLRGVSPMNASMPDLKRCFEAAGFTEVRTLLSSGNVAFNAGAGSTTALARRAETAMQDGLGRSFATTIRSSDCLQRLVESDPFAAFDPPAKAKCVVTFLHKPHAIDATLPIEHEGVRIVRADPMEVFTFYEPHPKGPVFMSLLERHFGKDITTRTFDTVRKCARA